MKTILVSMTLAAASLASACQSAAPQGLDDISETKQGLVTVSRSRWNGVSASGNAYGDHESLSFSVSEDKTGKKRTASLSLWGWGYDPASETCQTEQWCYPDDQGNEFCEDYTYCYYADQYYLSGWGEIPARAFRVGRRLNSANLTLDLANAPNFTASRCGYDGTCTPVTGTLDVSWTSNGAYSNSYDGTQTTQWGGYTQRTTGQSSSVSADVVGSALGLAVQGWGDVARSKGKSVSREVTTTGGGTGGFGGMAGIGGVGGVGGIGGTGGGGAGGDADAGI